MEQIMFLFILLCSLIFADNQFDLGLNADKAVFKKMSGSILFLNNQTNSFDGSSTRVLLGKGENIFSIELTKNITISKNTQFCLIARTAFYDLPVSIYLGKTFLGSIILKDTVWQEHSFTVVSPAVGKELIFHLETPQKTSFYVDSFKLATIKNDQSAIVTGNFEILGNPLVRHNFSRGILSYSLEHNGLLILQAKDEDLSLRPDRDLKILTYDRTSNRGKVFTEIKWLPKHLEFVLKKGQQAEILAPNQANLTVLGYD